MGASHSREGSLESDYSENEDEDEYEDKNQGRRSTGLEAQLQELSLGKADNDDNLVKLYKHIGGNTSKAKWVLCEKLVPYQFIREGDDDDEEEEEEDDDEEYYRGSNNSGSDGEFRSWFLRVGSKLQARVDNALQMKFLEEQVRVDFVQAGVWAIKFPTPESYHDFATEFRNCLFENTYGMEASDENKTKIFGNDFMAWADPHSNDAADETVWMTPEPTPPPSPTPSPSPSARNPTTPSTPKLQQRFEEDAQGGIQSVAMGALDYSFVLSDTGVEAVRNFRHGIHGKGVSVALSPADSGAAAKKGILMKSERQMVVMSPSSPAVQQLDVDAGKIVAEWHMRRDGADLRMSDITHDSKAAQLDPGASTFMGLGANSLCRWDMRSPAGIVQENRRRRGRSGNDGDGDGDGDGSSTVLSWANGHQFSRGTNFRCFATAGDGSLVVGSADGKIRLYGSSSLRQAKTAFPGLGSPITHVDVTYDAKWIVGTTDTYLIVISTVFTDKDGKLKTGFSGRMGHRIPVPRMLKLQPLDAYLAGDNKFHGGQFSWVTESGKEERHIVASVGKFTVIWNFNQVKNSNHECYKYQQGLKTCYCYRIVPKDESVVESKFMHEKFSFLDSPEAPLVVATPKKVSSFSIAS